MKMIKPVLMAMAVLTLMLATPAHALDTPKQAIGEETALVVWLDMQLVEPEMIEEFGGMLDGVMEAVEMFGVGGGLPLGNIDEMVDGMTEFRKGFVDAGGEGLLLTMKMPEEGSWSPPISLLAKTKPEVDAKAMRTLIQLMSEDEMDAELAPIGEDWHDLSIVRANGNQVTVPLPEKQDKKVYKAFDKQLGEVKSPVLSVAFMMQDELREMIGEMAEGAANGGNDNPQAAMFAGMLQPLQGLESLGFAISQDKKNFEIDIQMVFLKTADAQQFAQMYNTIMQLAPAFMAAQLQEIEDAPDANTVNKFFMSLVMKQNGDTLKLNLDKDFFELVEEMGPVFDGLGGPRGGGFEEGGDL